MTVSTDIDGIESEKLGGYVSGQTFLFDPSGTLAFDGGITFARGHSGDNAGRDALQALIRGRDRGNQRHPCFRLLPWPASRHHVTTTTDVLQLTQRRARENFDELQRRIFSQTDRMFAGLMAVQWLVGRRRRLWISPRTWAGTRASRTIHVWAAVVLGGAISAAADRAWRCCGPAQPITRHAIAVGADADRRRC